MFVPRRGVVAPAGPLAREQATRQGRPGNHAQTLIHAQRHHFALLFPVDEVVVVLHRDEAGPAVALRDRQHLHELPCKHGTGAQVENLSVANEAVERGQGLLDGGGGVGAVNLVEVDALHAQAPERGLARLNDVLRREASAVRPLAHPHAALGGDDRLIPHGVFPHPLAGDLLAHAERIHVRRIEEVDAEFDRAPEEGSGLFLFEHPGAPGAAPEAHAAERDARDHEAAVSE